jgi:hypothetical protein
MPMTIIRPHLKYREIREDAVNAARDLFEAKPWRLDSDAEKIEAVLPMLTQICESYRAVPVPQIIVASHIWSRYSYRPGQRMSLSSTNTPGTLTLKKFTVIDLFSGLRAHINAVTGSRLDAFAWACSLFYAAKPTMFRARVREGRIPGVVARSTYTQETWDALVSEGRADERTGRLVVEEVPSDETMEAVAEYVDALIEDEAAEGIDEISAMLSGEFEDDDDVSLADLEPMADASIGDDGLSGLNRDALRRLAATHNIAGRGTMSRDALEAALRAAGVRA